MSARPSPKPPSFLRSGSAGRDECRRTLESERQRIERDAAEFLLIEYGGGMERCYAWANPPDELLELASSQAHYVALLPSEYAGPLGDEVDPEDFLPRLGGSLIAEVSQPSDSCAKLRDLRRRQS